MSFSAVAAILLGLAVILGAFGAHALKGRLDESSISIYETAVLYHFIHALGLLVVSILPRAGVLTQSAALWVDWLLFLGIVVFSGSLYVLAMTGVRAWGAITPFSGLSFIAAWLLLAFWLIRGAPSPH